LKSFLSYLNMIDERELRNIPEDLYITKILESI